MIDARVRKTITEPDLLVIGGAKGAENNEPVICSDIEDVWAKNKKSNSFHMANG